jgi:hypothetical protein
MEKRSRRRIRDLVALAAFQGLSQNEIGCARISMMARSTNAPFKGRIQKRKTNHLQIITFGLQRTAGPYRWVNGVISIVGQPLPIFPLKTAIVRAGRHVSNVITTELCIAANSFLFDHLVGTGDQRWRHLEAESTWQSSY